jgi:ubiquinone/menaquinone biosynthesis C-methylase UbiE
MEKYNKVQKLTDNLGWSFSHREDNINHATAKKNNINFIRKMKIGFTLNICCGLDPNGDVKADIDDSLLMKVKKERLDDSEYVVCDVMNLPFRPRAFDTVVCDPPFSYYNKFKWIHELSKIARKRLILCVPMIDVHIDQDEWDRQLYYVPSTGIMLRLYWIFDRKEKNKDNIKLSECDAIWA